MNVTSGISINSPFEKSLFALTHIGVYELSNFTESTISFCTTTNLSAVLSMLFHVSLTLCKSTYVRFSLTYFIADEIPS